MKMKKLAPAAAAAAAMFSVAFAGDCVLEADAPAIPDPATATQADVNAAIAGIKAYQGALGDYRACLDTIVENKDLEKDERKAALDKFNASVDAETALVEDWQAFYAAYKEGQS